MLHVNVRTYVVDVAIKINMYGIHNYTYVYAML